VAGMAAYGAQFAQTRQCSVQGCDVVSGHDFALSLLKMKFFKTVRSQHGKAEILFSHHMENTAV